MLTMQNSVLRRTGNDDEGQHDDQQQQASAAAGTAPSTLIHGRLRCRSRFRIRRCDIRNVNHGRSWSRGGALHGCLERCPLAQQAVFFFQPPQCRVIRRALNLRQSWGLGHRNLIIRLLGDWPGLVHRRQSRGHGFPRIKDRAPCGTQATLQDDHGLVRCLRRRVSGWRTGFLRTRCRCRRHDGIATVLALPRPAGSLVRNLQNLAARGTGKFDHGHHLGTGCALVRCTYSADASEHCKVCHLTIPKKPKLLRLCIGCAQFTLPRAFGGCTPGEPTLLKLFRQQQEANAVTVYLTARAQDALSVYFAAYGCAPSKRLVEPRRPRPPPSAKLRA